MAMLAGRTKDWQLDKMREDENARIWEQENAHGKKWDRMLDSVAYLNVAIEHLNKATVSLVGAKDQVEGIPCEYKLGSLVDSLEELICDIQKMRRDFINGEG